MPTASPRHEGRDSLKGFTSEASGPNDRDRKDRQRPRHGHRDHRHDLKRDKSRVRHNHEERDHGRDCGHDRGFDHDRNRHPDKQSCRKCSGRLQEAKRESSRHGQYDDHEKRHRRDGDGHRHHDYGHDRKDKHPRRRAEEKDAQWPDNRHSRTDHARREKGPGGSQEVEGDNENENENALFRLDTRGDPLVWQFKSNNSRHMPSYVRFRRGNCVLGSKLRFNFDQEGSRTIFSAKPDITNKGSIFRERNSSLLYQGRRSETAIKKRKDAAIKRRKKFGDSANTIESSAAEADFVPLPASKKRKRNLDVSDSGNGSDNASQSNSDDDDTDGSAPSDDDSNEDNDCFSVTDDSRAIVQNKLSELSRRVKEAPQDIDAWLELVDLQDQQSLLLGNETVNGGAAELRSKDEITGISTIKLSILESALQQNQQPSGREQLQIALMREGSKVWTSKKASQRWSDLAQENASGSGLSFLLWKARLDFEMTNLSTLTVDHIKLFCADRLRALEIDAATSTGNTTKLLEIYSQMIYIFLRATRFLYDAGFRDLTAAAWQATLESSFSRPPTDVQGASLGEFWDSEIQRIGEEGAQGWQSFAAKVQAGEDPEEALLDYKVQSQTLPCPDFAKLAELARRSEINDMDEYMPLYEAWIAAERQRGDLAKLPARVIDDIDDIGFEDVFRVAVYSDFKGLLFRLPEALLSDLKPLLVDAFLLFCQLPPAFGTSPWIEDARNSPFLATIVLSGGNVANKKELQKDISQNPAVSSSRQPPDLFYDGSRIVGNFHVLFSSPGWFRYLPDWLSTTPPAGADAPVPPSWVANILRQLVRSFGFGQLAPYSLAADALVNPAGVKKTARALIKQYISNTALYEAYALAEVARGNIEVACAVLASATANVTEIKDELPLRISWAWIELEYGQRESAIRRLVLRSSLHEDTKYAAADLSRESQSISPAELLRLRHAFQTGMDYSLSSGIVRQAALYAQAAVLLNYLTPTTPGAQQPQEQQSRQGNLPMAISVAAQFTKEMQTRGHGTTSVHEEFLQSVARIIYFHATHGPYRPADLQAPLERMVILFPQNGIFLRLFAWIDPMLTSGLSRLRPDNALQKILDTVVLTRKMDCPSSRAFAIRLALKGGQGQGHAARAEFERALGGSHGSSNYNLACLGSARLWQEFVRTTAMDATASATVTVRSDGRKTRVRGVDKKLAALFKVVYYRAVRACPGSKDVLLECFGSRTGLMAASSEAAMSPSDLRAVYQTLISKGLRVHMDLGEVRERARKHFSKHKT
ncbi:hypothetical protein SEPCBS57363_003540 [Sporothrix epigloea]|uniref:Uncharacterized protein n=1 Tax=Sporothrix epigloea TaxID=1892477 RepID=A0ABP0DM16_9PEZI